LTSIKSSHTLIRKDTTLDHIAFVELGERKDGNPYETFREWYTKDYQSFIEYNIQDVEIVDKLEDKMKLIELALTMAYDAKVNFTDVLGTVRYWDILIYNYLRERNIVIPQKSDNKKVEKFEGAYVKDPQVGMHNWVMSFRLELPVSSPYHAIQHLTRNIGEWRHQTCRGYG
jgi:DNA polymerase elongation subunit (family B)